MEVVTTLMALGKALVNLKNQYDQHKDNANEIRELQEFIDQCEEQLRELQKRFINEKTNDVGTVVLKQLELDIASATSTLKSWSKDGTFFKMFDSVNRMKELQKLHRNVMESMQNKVGLAGLSMMLDIHLNQINFYGDLSAQLKSFLSTSMASMSQTVAREVRAVAYMTSRGTFADEKFWADVLAAVDGNLEGNNSMHRDFSVYLDPISKEFFVDPVVGSNGITYCRWTIIDNHMTSDPYNACTKLVIVADNVNLRGELFKEFPHQLKEFEHRRSSYREKALSLASEGRLADAIFALEHILLWNKSDERCAATLLQMQATLKEEQLRTTTTLQEENQHLRDQLNKCQISMSQMKLDIQENQKLLREKDEELNTLQKDLKDQEDSARKKIHNKNKECRELQKYVRDLQNQVQTLFGCQDLVGEWQDENISLSKEVIHVVEAFTALYEKVETTSAKVSAISERQCKVKVLRDKLEDLQKFVGSKSDLGENNETEEVRSSAFECSDSNPENIGDDTHPVEAKCYEAVHPMEPNTELTVCKDVCNSTEAVQPDVCRNTQIVGPDLKVKCSGGSRGSTQIAELDPEVKCTDNPHARQISEPVVEVECSGDAGVHTQLVEVKYSIRQPDAHGLAWSYLHKQNVKEAVGAEINIGNVPKTTCPIKKSRRTFRERCQHAVKTFKTQGIILPG